MNLSRILEEAKQNSLNTSLALRDDAGIEIPVGIPSTYMNTVTVTVVVTVTVTASEYFDWYYQLRAHIPLQNLRSQNNPPLFSLSLMITTSDHSSGNAKDIDIKDEVGSLLKIKINMRV